MLNRRFALVVTAAGLAAPASGQLSTLVADRTARTIWRLLDSNASGAINDPGEVHPFFDAGNLQGTPGLSNPTALASWLDGTVAVGDQGNRSLYILHDTSGNGDAQGLGESAVAADATNASGIALSFLTGLAFDGGGRLYGVNAGNATGPDGVFRFTDLNGDGEFQDAGEITVYVGEPTLGPGNGPFSLQEAFFDAQGALYVRNSSTSGVAVQGVYKAVDLDGDGRADGPGEFTLFFGPGNLSGVTLSAGFALEPDAVRPGAMYVLQIATGGIDVLLRVRDANGDGDAMDAGEAREVWRTAETGFTGVDVQSLADGSVLITDNSGKRVVRLSDNDHDDLFTSAGERRDWYVSTAGVVGDVRQSTLLGLCRADFNQDGFVDFFDADAYIQCFQGGVCPPRSSADFNGDLFADFFDLDSFIETFEAGC